MDYSALRGMKIVNGKRFGHEIDVNIPKLLSEEDKKAGIRNYGVDALRFIREDCVRLKFDPERNDLQDSDGRSVGIGQIPYNMERDLDRLSFERAILRFLKSGSREDAFDIYYCYCEIFHPFGGGYEEADTMLRMLSDHESNASSLLMKHRDHYSHSVYVFCIGLAIYKNHKPFREAYKKRFGLTERHEAACHFLEYWGLTSLFHDVGYPFEIAHQQMKSYVCKLDKEHNSEETGFAPHISYKGMEQFRQSSVGDLNDLFAEAITNRMGSYLSRVSVESYICHYKLREALMDRAVHDNTANKDYLYMDHAYFSGLILAKNYLEHRKGTDIMSEDSKPVLDSLCAVMLHNSLFRFTMRKFLYTKEPLRLDDDQPLTYLLMLCDELQCWDRTCYGQNTRRKVYPFDFEMEFPTAETMKVSYFFDVRHEKDTSDKSNFKNMSRYGYETKSKMEVKGRSKFLDDIGEIIALEDVINGFDADRKKSYGGEYIGAQYIPNGKPRTLTLSSSNYLNLYQFAIALFGGFNNTPVEELEKQEILEELKIAFETNQSLEYKLSNIAQARRYAVLLEKIGCFYTDRAVDYTPVDSFTSDDIETISKEEHERWCAEKEGMGWGYGNYQIQWDNLMDEDQRNKLNRMMRECTRKRNNLKPFDQLEDFDQVKNVNAINIMLKLLYKYDGLTIYRLDLDENGFPSKMLPSHVRKILKGLC